MCVFVSQIRREWEKKERKGQGMRKARKERIRTRKRGNEGTKLGEDYRAIQLVECYFRRSQRDSIHTEGDSLLPQRSSRGETGRQRKNTKELCSSRTAKTTMGAF